MRSFLAAAALLALGSCYSITHDYSGAREVTPGTTLSQGSAPIGRVEAQRRAHFLFWGLVPLNSPSGPEAAEALALEQYGEDFDGLARVTIREEYRALDYVVAFFTLGIFSMVSIDTKAEVRRFEGEASPAREVAP